MRNGPRPKREGGQELSRGGRSQFCRRNPRPFRAREDVNVSHAPVIRGPNEAGSCWPSYRRWVCGPQDSIDVFACALGIVQGQIRTLHQSVRVLAMDGIDTDSSADGYANGMALDVIRLRHSLDYF